jgi:signal transduction histidine kinase
MPERPWSSGPASDRDARRRLYVEMSFAIVKGDTDGDVIGAVAVARDVTERVERERAARASS